jgi:deoxycytidine triphosphate deaminase
VLLSDRDIRAELDSGRVKIDPLDPSMVQPSSVDVRLDKYFRVFENHKYPHIDPAEEQADLTRLVDVESDEAFVLHPGEFVLASTYEVFGLPDNLAARLEGKALAVSTPIPTPGGWKLMSELRVGDEVFDEHGRPTTVVDATEIMYDRECRRVVFSSGEAIVADVDHQWVTSTRNERTTKKAPSIRTTREIEVSLRAGAEWNHHVQLAGPVQYPEQDLPIDPYTLGIRLGDGTTTKAEVTVGAGDEQILDEIKGAGSAVWPATGPRAFRIGGITLGVLGNKHVPEVYLRSSIEQRLALLQGLMDSEGHVDKFGRCEFVNMREGLSILVTRLAASLGLRPTRRLKSVSFEGRCMGLAHQVKFTPDLPVFRLERKLARLKASVPHRFRAIVDVQTVPMQPVRCIQVANPTGMFLAGPGYIPTHNSSLGRLGLLTHSTAGWIDPGFCGHVTLELSNVATLPIKLWPGMKIGQMCLFRTTSPAEFPYGSKEYGSRYQGQRGPTPSRSYLNFHRTEV